MCPQPLKRATTVECFLASVSLAGNFSGSLTTLYLALLVAIVLLLLASLTENPTGYELTLFGPFNAICLYLFSYAALVVGNITTRASSSVEISNCLA